MRHSHAEDVLGANASKIDIDFYNSVTSQRSDCDMIIYHTVISKYRISHCGRETLGDDIFSPRALHRPKVHARGSKSDLLKNLRRREERQEESSIRFIKHIDRWTIRLAMIMLLRHLNLNQLNKQVSSTLESSRRGGEVGGGGSSSGGAGQDNEDVRVSD